MKKQQQSKLTKKAKTAAIEKKQLHRRLAKPDIILKEDSQRTSVNTAVSRSSIPLSDSTATTLSEKEDSLLEYRAETNIHQSLEHTTESISMENKPTKTSIAEPTPATDKPDVDSPVQLNLADSGFLEEVIVREYAEKPQTQTPEDTKPVVEQQAEARQGQHLAQEAKPKIVFAPKLTLKTDETYKRVMGDEAPENSTGKSSESFSIADDGIPTMQYQEATFNLADDAEPLGRQMGEHAGNTTSEWAFGMLENFYPELVAFFTKIPTDWVEKAKLPNALEAQMLQNILSANARNKNRVKISDFHKKNILPPLKRILEKKGWENVMPDELLLVIGLVVLAADSFFKIGEIKKENRVLEKQIRQKIQEYIDVRTEERKEIDSLKGQLTEMQNFFAQLKAQQQAAA